MVQVGICSEREATYAIANQKMQDAQLTAALANKDTQKIVKALENTHFSFGNEQKEIKDLLTKTAMNTDRLTYEQIIWYFWERSY